MGRRTHRNRVEAGASEVTDSRGVSHLRDDGQRSAPEAGGKTQGAVVELGDPFGGGEIDHVRDQWIEAGPSFGVIEAGEGGRVGCGGGEGGHGGPAEEDEGGRALRGARGGVRGARAVTYMGTGAPASSD